jgi:hypothetical protein
MDVDVGVGVGFELILESVRKISFCEIGNS